MSHSWKDLGIAPDEPLKLAVLKAARFRFEEVMSLDQAALQGIDVESLHEKRVSTRRLLSMMKIYRECFPKKKNKKYQRVLKQYLEAMGRVREHDVFLVILKEYGERFSEARATGLDLLIAKETALRVREHRSMRKELRQLHRNGFDVSFRKFLS